MRPRRLQHAIGREIVAQLVVVTEWKVVSVRFYEKVEGVDDFEIGKEVDGNRKLGGLFGEDVAGDPVPVRVLLPIHEMLLGFDLERVAQHPGPAMRRRTQPHNLRSKADRPVILVARDVVKTRDNSHRNPSLLTNFWRRPGSVIAVRCRSNTCLIIMQFPGRTPAGAWGRYLGPLRPANPRAAPAI